MFGDSFFKKVEKKTNVNKETILSLASKLQDSNMKDENTLRELIQEISNITGKEVSKEKSDDKGHYNRAVFPRKIANSSYGQPRKAAA